MSISSLKLDISQETVYNIGETIDLILQIDQTDATIIGDAITVNICDIFNNIISTISAELIQDNVYAAEYTIPFNIAELYNINNEDDSLLDSSCFALKDVWVIPNSTNLEYQLLVSRVLTESPIQDNCKLLISIDGLLDINNNTIEKTDIEFTTKLSPFYGNIDSIKSWHRSELDEVSNMDIAYDIIEWSKYVDLHLRPDNIVYKDAYDNAVREYINASIAKNLLLSVLNTTAEEKQIDTLRIRKESSGGQMILKKIEELIDTYERMIYAGGLDTPFRNKLFVKGVQDPNRPNVSRARLDSSDIFPWVNTTTASTIINIDGQEVEIRGTRTVQFRTPVLNIATAGDSYSHGIEVSF